MSYKRVEPNPQGAYGRNLPIPTTRKPQRETLDHKLRRAKKIVQSYEALRCL